MEDNFNKDQFAQRLKEIRKAKGLTQEVLCEKAGIDVTNYSKIETGKTTPSLKSLYKIIKGVSYEPNEVFEYEHLVDEKLLDQKIQYMYKNYSLKEKQFLYKFMRNLEDYFM